VVEDMRVLDLFSGIGGFSLGLERAGMETVAFCEYDEKCRKVLKKHWPDVPQYNDVRTLTAEQLKNDGITIDLICGGYPCQPFSTAGKRAGEEDDRHLWPEVLRLIQEIRPAWVLCENVAGHISMGLDSVLADLEGEGYQQQVFIIPACAVGAYHRRDRVWILAHADELTNGQQHIDAATQHNNERAVSTLAHTESERRGEAGKSSTGRSIGATGASAASENVADTDSERGRSGATGAKDAGHARQSSRDTRYDRSGVGRWLPEPAVGRVADGVPGRVDRLKQLGNAVVPQVVEMIGRAIMESEA